MVEEMTRGTHLHDGFTLVEVLIVVSILAIIAVLSRPVLSSAFDQGDLSAAATEVKAAMEYAQLLAVSTGLPCRVTVDPSSNSVLVEQLAPASGFWTSGVTEINRSVVETQSYQVVGHPLKPGLEYRVPLNGDPRFGGVTVIGTTLGAGNSVVFDLAGKPSTGGTITLGRNVGRIVLTLNATSGKAG